MGLDPRDIGADVTRPFGNDVGRTGREIHESRISDQDYGTVFVARPQRGIPPAGAKVQVMVEMPPARADSRAGQLAGVGLAMRQEYVFGQPIGFSATVRFRSRWAYSDGNLASESSVQKRAALAVVSRTGIAARGLGRDEDRLIFVGLNVY